MGYKHVTVEVQGKWADKQQKQGIAPVEALLRHFVKGTEWHIAVLDQSSSGCVFLIKSELIGEMRVRDAIREFFKVKLLLPEDQFADIVALKFKGVEKSAALALEKELIEANKVKAAQNTAKTNTSDAERDACNFTQAVQDYRPKLLKDTPIEALDLSVRSFSCLKRAGIDSVEALTGYTREGLSQVRNLGRNCIDEIEGKLSEMGLCLAASDSDSRYTKTVAGESATEPGVDEMFCGKEFTELLAEFKKIAPVITGSGTHEIFISQAYLFAINNGCGLSSRLVTLSTTLTQLGLFKGGSGSIREFIISMGQDDKDIYANWKSFLSDLAGAYIKNGTPIIVCVDICEWLPHIKEARFQYYMRQLDKYTGKLIFVFRVPFLEKDALDNVRRVLSDVFTIRTVPFPPFTTEELLQNAREILRGNGFVLSEDAVSVLTTRISEEKRDGRFYGITTLKKILRETVYLKQLSIAEGKNPDTVTISSGDILKLSESFEATVKTGMELFDELIGLGSLKEQILGILTQIEAARKSKKQMPCIHMRFTGSPGTGKTTVARILGKILNEKGILRNGGFFEYSGRDFCGRYIGETAPKTAAMCRDAYGSVLFIDEAYSLFTGDSDTKDFGREALATLIAEMENHRNDLLVIMAGYTDEMEALMRGNAGLKSRMPYTLTFPNYDRKELVSIFMAMARSEFACDNGLKTSVTKYFKGLSDEALSDKEFSNARFVRNLYERTWGKALLRNQLSAGSGELTLDAEDFCQAASEGEFKAMLEKKHRRIGFEA